MAWASGYEAVEVGDAALHRLISEKTGRMGEGTALVDGPTGQVVSYGTLASRIERVAAVVPRGDLDAGALMDWVAEKVAPHKKLRAVRFVDAVPKTPSGELLRRVLAEQDRRSVLQTST